MHKTSFFHQLIGRIASNIQARLSPQAMRAHMSSPITEANVTQGTDYSALYRDRYDYDRQKILEEALLAWRLNPLARRIVEIQTQYITDGIEFHCDDPATEKFLQEFWNHPLNRIGEHLKEWADELALTGNLFPCLTTDSAGMSYLRIFPTDMLAEIETKPNDVQQETAYLPKQTAANPDPVHIANYWAAKGSRSGAKMTQKTSPKVVMLHYAVNRLAGMLWGEPDIAPLLPWLARYAAWLEDRARLNRFRQAYLYIVKGQYPNEAAKRARQKEFQASPPAPGTILVTDQSEEWDVINPKLDSFEANNDGLALKKFIAGGRGLPLHWLSEPESSTRTTAEAAGTPTFKGLESRQRLFLSLLKDILQVVVNRRAQRAGDVKPEAAITIDASDISERDNAALALASTQVITSFGQLWANGFIDDDEYMRIVYRFAGETLPSARPDAPHSKVPTAPGGRTTPGDENADGLAVQIDSETGDVRVKEPKS
jgi:hypothetical protein